MTETLYDKELANIYGIDENPADPIEDGWTEEALEELQQIIAEEAMGKQA
jgi:hypothetical protein